MRIGRWAAAVICAMAAGCAAPEAAGPPRGPDFFPLNDGAYWFFDGIAGAEGTRVGIRVVGGTGSTKPARVQIAWQQPGAAQAEVMDLAAAWRGGYLVLQDRPYELRLLPERPKRQEGAWKWKSGADPFRGRILRHDGFVASPAGRWRDALVVEVGPADGTPEQWRWHFVRGEGPVRIEVGAGDTLQVLELTSQGGSRALPSANWGTPTAPAPAKQPAPAPAKKPAAPAGK